MPKLFENHKDVNHVVGIKERCAIYDGKPGMFLQVRFHL
jgi:hypothetical protein